jgi:hypothetical protein
MQEMLSDNEKMTSKMLRGWKTCALLMCMSAAPGWCALQSTGRAFYVDCSKAASGSGSIEAPWNNLNSVNTMTFGPGDSIHLRRGTVCHGVLFLHGSGSEGQPVRLTSYSEGARPMVKADSSAEEILRLFNQQYWDIDSLDLSGGNTYGIFISGNKGILHHIHLSNLAVHDVLGGKMMHKESGLIAISPSNASQHFDDVLVDGITAYNTNQWVGILVGGGNLGYPPESDWSSNVVIRNSLVHDVQGDGIVLFRVRHGLITSSIAWNTGMQETESIGTPNAIWTWMCDDCTVQGSEAYLTDSPGVDGGAFDIDYGNTKNAVLDNYGHDTQGYCIAVFGAGFVTMESRVSGNLCINNGRSPRMAKYQGAIFLWSWNGGSIDGLTMEDNTIYWNPLENSPALVNRAAIKPGTATFRRNTIHSTAPWLVESNTSLTLRHNDYKYYGAETPYWHYGAKSFASLQLLQLTADQDIAGSLEQQPLRAWPRIFARSDPSPHSSLLKELRTWQLDCVLPVSLSEAGLLNNEALRQIVILKSISQQYRPQGLRVTLRLTSPDTSLFDSDAFRNALTDLNLSGVAISHSSGRSAQRLTLSVAGGKITNRWDGPVGPVDLGLALRKAMGKPFYSQMAVQPNE